MLWPNKTTHGECSLVPLDHANNLNLCNISPRLRSSSSILFASAQGHPIHQQRVRWRVVGHLQLAPAAAEVRLLLVPGARVEVQYPTEAVGLLGQLYWCIITLKSLVSWWYIIKSILNGDHKANYNWVLNLINHLTIDRCIYPKP